MDTTTSSWGRFRTLVSLLDGSPVDMKRKQYWSRLPCQKKSLGFLPLHSYLFLLFGFWGSCSCSRVDYNILLYVPICVLEWINHVQIILLWIFNNHQTSKNIIKGQILVINTSQKYRKNKKKPQKNQKLMVHLFLFGTALLIYHLFVYQKKRTEN